MQALNVCLAPLGKGDCGQAKKMDRAPVDVAGVRRTGSACWPDDAKTNPARKLLWPRVKWLQSIVKTRSAKSMIIRIVIDACAGSMSRKRRAECKRAVHYTQCSGPWPRDTRDWQHAYCQSILSQTGEGHRLTVQDLAHVVPRRNQSDRCPESPRA